MCDSVKILLWSFNVKKNKQNKTTPKNKKRSMIAFLGLRKHFGYHYNSVKLLNETVLTHRLNLFVKMFNFCIFICSLYIMWSLVSVPTVNRLKDYHCLWRGSTRLTTDYEGLFTGCVHMTTLQHFHRFQLPNKLNIVENQHCISVHTADREAFWRLAHMFRTQFWPWDLHKQRLSRKMS